jgi:hypothetical protein
MAKFFRPAFAVLLGIVLGSVVNMLLIMVSGKIIPPPAGADVTTMEGLKASLHLFQPKHFIFPFLAHALGTLSGAYTASLVAKLPSLTPAFIVGVFFLIGGIANVFLLPGPMWFNALDILVCYLPMARLGSYLAKRTQPAQATALPA